MTKDKRQNFGEREHLEAYSRQNGRCGLCGELIRRPGINDGPLRSYQAHHVLRDADGGAPLLDNCVLLCTNNDKNEDCHFSAHGYNFGRKFMLYPSEYKYFEYNHSTKEYELLSDDYHPPLKEGYYWKGNAVKKKGQNKIQKGS